MLRIHNEICSPAAHPKQCVRILQQPGTCIGMQLQATAPAPSNATKNNLQYYSQYGTITCVLESTKNRALEQPVVTGGENGDIDRRSDAGR